MSKYESIVPENIASNNFEFHGASIEIETDSVWPYPGYEQYRFFNGFGATNNTPPPHFIGIRSNKLLIVDQYDFTASWDVAYMTCKDYKIESSLDGKTWDTLYTGIVPSTSLYDAKCEFKPTICKQIRCTILSTYDARGYKWFQGKNFKIYGTLAGPFLYTNPDAAYGIRKKEG